MKKLTCVCLFFVCCYVPLAAQGVTEVPVSSTKLVAAMNHGLADLGFEFIRFQMAGHVKSGAALVSLTIAMDVKCPDGRVHATSLVLSPMANLKLFEQTVLVENGERFLGIEEVARRSIGANFDDKAFQLAEASFFGETAGRLCYTPARYQVVSVLQNQQGKFLFRPISISVEKYRSLVQGK